jgi:hypothetical protein
VGELFIEGDEMGDINIAVVLLEKNILPNLISVGQLACHSRKTQKPKIPIDESIAKLELQDEVLQLRLNLTTGIFIFSIVWRQHAQRVHRLAIHCAE